MKSKYLILIFLLICFVIVGNAGATNTTQYDNKLVLCIHMNGIAGGTVFTEETGKVVTRISNPTTNTTSVKLGNASGWFSGANYGDALAVPSSSDFEFGSGDFTIMWWENRQTIYNGGETPFSRDNSTTYVPWVLGYGTKPSTLAIYMSSTGTSWDMASGKSLGTFSQGWKQYVVSRNGTTFRAYQNGVQTDTWTNAASFVANSNPLSIGMTAADKYSYRGNLDEMAIWKGVYIPIGDLYPMPYEIKTQSSSTPIASFTSINISIATNSTARGWEGLAPFAMQFNDTSTNTPTYGNYTYQGYGSNTTLGYNFSTSLNTIATFTAGNFSISHGAGNAAGFNLSTQITWINVTNNVPVVSFTVNVTSGLMPLVVAFNDTSTGNITSRFWDFGDVTNSTGASPVKTYSTAGTYTVNLTETNLDVSNSTTKTINVYNPANSQFSSFNTAGTAPFSTYLYDLSTNTTPGTDTWYWMFGDGNTSTAQSLYYTWNITGTYAINHSFSNGVSTSWINKSAYIVVGTPTPPVVAPVASFYGGPQIGAPPLLVYLTDVSSNTPTSWNWSFGDGTYGITQNPSHWYNSSGFFTVGLTATNTAGSNTTSQNNFIMVY